MKILPAFFMIVILCGCIGDKNPVGESPSETTTLTTSTSSLTPPEDVKPEIKSFTVPKKVYKSREKMNLTVQVGSIADLENATVKVYGIHSRYDRLNKKKTMDLAKGENTVIFEYTMPSCTGCAGISPGPYNITAEVSVGGKIIENKTLTVEIQQ